jgi:tetratricopeptide (TPR) repeat protein
MLYFSLGMIKRGWIVVTCIAVIGLALRLAFTLTMKAKWPGWDTPAIDALYHHLWAQHIASGQIFSGGPFFRAPLYPYLLAAIYAIFGIKFLTVYIIQNLLGTAAIVLTYLTARELFSKTTAYIAAGLVAINGVLIFFEAQLLLDFLTVDFSLLIVYFLLQAHKKNSLWYYLGAGLWTSLFAITRPNILAVVPLLVIWILFQKRPFKSAIRPGLIFFTGVIILIVPVTLRNVIIGHDNVLIASQGGINFYIGNNETADGCTALLPGKGHSWQYSDAEYDAAIDLGVKPGTLKPSQVSDYYYDKAYKFIFNSPWKFVKLTIKKLYLFWNWYEISNNNSLYFITKYIGLGFYPLYLFAIIAPLGIVGAILCFWRERRYWLLPLVTFGYMATVIAYFVTDRFRLPVIPLLSITAAFAMTEVFSALKQTNYKMVIKIIAVFLFVGIFSWSNFYNHHDSSNALAHYSLGNVFLSKGNYEKAKNEYNKALSLTARVPHAHTNLGVIAFYEQDTTTARKEFEKEIASSGPTGKAYNNLSLLKRLGGDYLAAYALADSAIMFFPNYKDAYINRVLAAFASKDSMRIKNSADSFVKAFPHDFAARYYNGLYYWSIGQSDSARSEFTYVTTAGGQDIVSEYDLSEIYSAALPYGYNPQKIKGKAYYQLGLIEAGNRNIENTLANFQKAVELSPDDPDAHANLALAYDQSRNYEKALSEFQNAIKLDSTNAIYFFNYALTLGKMGQIRQSEIMLSKAVNIDPGFEAAKAKLAALKQYLKTNPEMLK